MGRALSDTATQTAQLVTNRHVPCRKVLLQHLNCQKEDNTSAGCRYRTEHHSTLVFTYPCCGDCWGHDGVSSRLVCAGGKAACTQVAEQVWCHCCLVISNDSNSIVPVLQMTHPCCLASLPTASLSTEAACRAGHAGGQPWCCQCICCCGCCGPAAGRMGGNR